VIGQLLGKKDLDFQRSYAASVDDVWRAWTEADRLRQWWGPDKTVVAECEVDLRVGGRLYVVTEGGQAMGKYAGTRWPMEATFTRIEPSTRLTYDARSWTEGAPVDQTIHHTNDLTLTSSDDGKTTVELHISVTGIAPGVKSRLALAGMGWGYASQLKALGGFLGTAR
jgi:uncharacterized protein YndB with AHSA1/START domain